MGWSKGNMSITWTAAVALVLPQKGQECECEREVLISKREKRMCARVLLDSIGLIASSVGHDRVTTEV